MLPAIPSKNTSSPSANAGLNPFTSGAAGGGSNKRIGKCMSHSPASSGVPIGLSIPGVDIPAFKKPKSASASDDLLPPDFTIQLMIPPERKVDGIVPAMSNMSLAGDRALVEAFKSEARKEHMAFIRGAFTESETISARAVQRRLSDLGFNETDIDRLLLGVQGSGGEGTPRNSLLSVDSLCDAIAAMEEKGKRAGHFGIVKQCMRANAVVEVRCVTTTSDSRMSRLFYSEYMLFSKLSHPCIAKFRAAVPSETAFLLVMDPVHGMSLKDWVKTHGPMNEDVGRSVCEQLLSALNHAHEEGVVMHTLSADKVYCSDSLMNEETRVVITDVGFYKLMTDSQAAQQPTIYYPPEWHKLQQSGQEEGTPHSSFDMWSAGVLFHFILTGTLPFPTDPKELFETITTTRYAPPAQLSHPCQSLLKRLLDRRPFTRLSAFSALGMPWITNKPFSELDFNPLSDEAASPISPMRVDSPVTAAGAAAGGGAGAGAAPPRRSPKMSLDVQMGVGRDASPERAARRLTPKMSVDSYSGGARNLSPSHALGGPGSPKTGVPLANIPLGPIGSPKTSKCGSGMEWGMLPQDGRPIPLEGRPPVGASPCGPGSPLRRHRHPERPEPLAEHPEGGQ